MREQLLSSDEYTIEEAVNECPWACCYIIVDGGYHFYESIVDLSNNNGWDMDDLLDADELVIIEN